MIICSAGKVVSGYRVHKDGEGEDHWTLLGKRDPQTPQMFYPVMNNVTVRYGDRLVRRGEREGAIAVFIS